MKIDLTLTDTDRDIVYECTVNARVVAEIGGAPGHCCDIDSVWVNSATVTIKKVACLVALPPRKWWTFSNHVAELFDGEIRATCIEHFEGQRVLEPIRDASVERGLLALAKHRPELADKCRTILLAGEKHKVEK